MTTSKTHAKKRAPVTIPAAAAGKKIAATRNPAAKLALPAVAPAARPKAKLIRDSFTIPKAEYAVLDALKLRAAALMRPTKKSEVLRAGIFALNAMNDKALLVALNSVPSLKTGRPKKLPPPSAAATTAAAAKPASRRSGNGAVPAHTSPSD